MTHHKRLEHEYTTTSQNIAIILSKFDQTPITPTPGKSTHKYQTRHNPYGQSSYSQVKKDVAARSKRHPKSDYEDDTVEEMDATYSEHDNDSQYETEHHTEPVHPNPTQQTEKKSWLGRIY